MFGVSEHISPELGSFLYKPRSSLYPCERESWSVTFMTFKHTWVWVYGVYRMFLIVCLFIITRLSFHYKLFSPPWYHASIFSPCFELSAHLIKSRRLLCFHLAYGAAAFHAVNNFWSPVVFFPIFPPSVFLLRFCFCFYSNGTLLLVMYTW